MSPSRIPRPGSNLHGSPTAQGSPHNRASTNSPNPSCPLANASPKLHSHSHFKPNNPFAQRVQAQSFQRTTSPILSTAISGLPVSAINSSPNSPPPTAITGTGLTAGHAAGRLQPPQTIRRRPKPPTAEFDDLHGSPPTSIGVSPGQVQAQVQVQRARRATPGGRNLGPSHNSGSPDSAHRNSNTFVRTGGLMNASPIANANDNPPNGPQIARQRSCLRQPSVPVLSTFDRRSTQNQVEPVRGRARALSAATGLSQPVQTISYGQIRSHGSMPQRTLDENTQSSQQQTRRTHLFEHSFTDREPAVPPHIRVRLKLIHQLGVVLGVDAAGISSLIDIPGLLARVDAAYDRVNGDIIQYNGMGSGGNDIGRESIGRRGSIAQTSCLPLPSPTSSTGSNRHSVLLLDEEVGRGGGGAGMKISKIQGPTTHAQSQGNGHGVIGVLRRLGGRKSLDQGVQKPNYLPASEPRAEGPAFGVPLNEVPGGAWCTSLIGGQKHELPLVVFTIVEEIYRRGMSQPGIFRLAGDGTRISHLTKVFNLPPLYGDSLSITSEPIHNLTGLVKRYVRDLPEPVLDESILPAFIAFCVDPNDHIPPGSNESVDDKDTPPKQPNPRSLEVRTTAAQILLRLLPPLHFSLFIYMLAFLGQLPMFPDNRLNVESISIIFGPGLCASRGKGISGLGPSANGGCKGDRELDNEKMSDIVNNSQSVLAWLLRHWVRISEKILDGVDDDFIASITSEDSNRVGAGPPVNDKRESMEAVIDPRLLSPIDLRLSPGDNKPPQRRTSMPDMSTAMPALSITANTNQQIAFPITPAPTPERNTSNSSTASSKTAVSDSRPESRTGSVSLNSSTSMGGFISRALSSMSISSFGAEDDDGQRREKEKSRKDRDKEKEKEKEKEKAPKRSASFTSLSSLMKKGAGGLRSKSIGMGAVRSYSDDRDRDREKERDRDAAHNPVNPQITNVLGSLHDLLVSKDKQIERDAKELALLRHTLLGMDEKLQRALKATKSNACHCKAGGDGAPPTPAITITTTPSLLALNASSAVQQEITDLQGQLTTALAALETARVAGQTHNDKIVDLEARMSRMDGEKKMELGRLEVALALESAKVAGLIDERDLARERLEKIKTTLFAVN